MAIGDSNSIFPSGSPIERVWTGSTDLKAPKPLDGEIFDRRYFKLLKKVKPLMEIKKEADEVYSRGYFENHYPEADKTLKRMLHQKAMDAWARSRGNDDDSEEKEEAGEDNHGRTVNITICLGR